MNLIVFLYAEAGAILRPYIHANKLTNEESKKIYKQCLPKMCSYLKGSSLNRSNSKLIRDAFRKFLEKRIQCYRIERKKSMHG
eukprot:TRINITY_DN1154_c0_g1_i2.p1 TRINITY_DN1154_c0_g1~~TRINITY_DN1154_c0_g1_i2.p1  ORF type:complete len:83 (+),score=16.74 TRINITY_DN1154_c0_g1_i2:218-466(+)